MDVPPSLRGWLVVDATLDVLVALPLVVAPTHLLTRLGWTVVDPVSTRLLGAALLALGVQSWRGRAGSIADLRAVLGVKLAWTVAAIVGLVIAITEGAPSAAFALLSATLALCGVWSHYAIRLRQLAEFEIRRRSTSAASEPDQSTDVGPEAMDTKDADSAPGS